MLHIRLVREMKGETVPVPIIHRLLWNTHAALEQRKTEDMYLTERAVASIAERVFSLDDWATLCAAYIRPAGIGRLLRCLPRGWLTFSRCATTRAWRYRPLVAGNANLGGFKAILRILKGAWCSTTPVLVGGGGQSSGGGAGCATAAAVAHGNGVSGGGETSEATAAAAGSGHWTELPGGGAKRDTVFVEMMKASVHFKDLVWTGDCDPAVSPGDMLCQTFDAPSFSDLLSAFPGVFKVHAASQTVQLYAPATPVPYTEPRTLYGTNSQKVTQLKWTSGKGTRHWNAATWAPSRGKTQMERSSYTGPVCRQDGWWR